MRYEIAAAAANGGSGGGSDSAGNPISGVDGFNIGRLTIATSGT